MLRMMRRRLEVFYRWGVVERFGVSVWRRELKGGGYFVKIPEIAKKMPRTTTYLPR